MNIDRIIYKLGILRARYGREATATVMVLNEKNTYMVYNKEGALVSAGVLEEVEETISEQLNRTQME